MIFNKNLFKAAASTLLGLSLLTFSACQQDTDLSPVKENSKAVAARDAKNGEIIPGKYIVVLKGGESTLGVRPDATYEEKVAAAKGQAEQLLGKYGIGRDNVERAYGTAIKGFVANLSVDEFKKLSADPAVAYIEPDRVVSLGNVNTENVVNISATDEIPYGIAKVGYGDGTGKTVWVIDTGVDLDHPDLNVDVARSRTFFTSGRDASSADDGNGHGSHVAGTIAAKQNGLGVLGVAYNATVVGVKVLDSRGSGSNSTVIAGVDYVASAAKAGEVANMSLGGGASTAIDNAVINAANKGVKFAIAAGNSSTSATTSSPARVNHANVVTISAVDINNRFASFSNYGNPPVDFAAPGVSIKSTWKGGAYNTISGTSMATPHVAGILTLGNINISGYAIGDPDGNADPIARR